MIVGGSQIIIRRSPGKHENRFKGVNSLMSRCSESKSFVQSHTLTEVAQELQNGSGWLQNQAILCRMDREGQDGRREPRQEEVKSEIQNRALWQK